jgi:hypothetical protein
MRNIVFDFNSPIDGLLPFLAHFSHFLPCRPMGDGNPLPAGCWFEFLEYCMRFASGLASGFLAFMAAASAALASPDFTCTNAGALRRIMVETEAPDRPLPCAVWRLSHPLGAYAKNWQLLWRARNDPAFCAQKVDEYVERWSDAGWQCVATREWRSTPFR